MQTIVRSDPTGYGCWWEPPAGMLITEMKSQARMGVAGAVWVKG